MVSKITWSEPSDVNTITVEISRSSTKHETYIVVDTIDATSDSLAKSSSNTWVTEYTDPSGLKTHWYKIKFYDGTYWSDYSSPITTEKETTLCSIEQVKRTISTVGRWSDTEIFQAIEDTDAGIYIEFGTPLKAIETTGGKDSDGTIFKRFYVGEEDIYRFDRVFYGTTNGMMTEIFVDDSYEANVLRGMIQLSTTGSSAVPLTASTDLEIQYVPKIFNELSLFRTAKSLLDELDYEQGKPCKEWFVMKRKLGYIERLLNDNVGVQLSSMVKYYDSKYGVNKKRLRQDFERNKYVGSTGW